MTEKRFVPIFDGFDKRVVGAKDNGVIISFMDMFDLLNELHEENEQLRHDATILIQSNQDYRKENEQLKQYKDTTFVLINEMIETANIYRTPIKSISYGDDLGYWNGVYQKLKELKEILEKDGEQNGN